MNRILIVEDNPINIDLLKRRLERAGFEVMTALDGGDAEQMAENNAPDVILMDLMMTEVSGQEAIQRLQKNTNTSDIPIIAVTACDLSEIRAQCMSLGCSDFEAKPVDMQRLTRKIQSCVSTIPAAADAADAADKDDADDPTTVIELSQADFEKIFNDPERLKAIKRKISIQSGPFTD
ncbi:MAG: response regulator [Hyphomicrobiales bacterium]|nr:response regulator [Hyphomicrobiales bacterium]